jgi:hypothetical protein
MKTPILTVDQKSNLCRRTILRVVALEPAATTLLLLVAIHFP